MANQKCAKFACIVCGVCSDQPKPGSSRPLSDNRRGHLPFNHGRRSQIADGILVFILGNQAEEGRPLTQIDVYSGINGYHIRTIPADRRYRNAVNIGAGCGMLAVVDRYQYYDLIRITDKFAGAGESGYDDRGQPNDSVDWEHLPDLAQIPTKTGTRVEGVTILPDGLLIATLSGGSQFLKADLNGRRRGYPNRHLEGVLQCWPEVTERFGAFVGTPCSKQTGASKETFWFLAAQQGSDGGAVSVIDGITGKVMSLLAIPPGEGLRGVGCSNDVATVAVGTDEEITKIYRFMLQGNSYMMSHPLSKAPGQEEYQVQVMPAYRDLPETLASGIDVNIRRYWLGATAINERGLEKGVDSPTPSKKLRRLKTPQSSTALNDGRTGYNTHLPANAVYNGGKIGVMEITSPPGLKLKAITSNFGVVAELFARVGSDGAPDSTQPLFRLVHGNSYDFILDGGWTLGASDDATGEDFVNTNSLSPTAIAIDKDYDMGTLKSGDLKVALIDKLTGLFIFRFSKPLKGLKSNGKSYRLYSGKYAGLDSGTKAHRTSGTTKMEGYAGTIDGIDRPEHKALRVTDQDSLAVPAFANLLDCDEPWAMFLRHTQSPSRLTVHPSVETWSMREDGVIGPGPWFPEFRNPQSPIVSVGSNAMMFPPRSHNTEKTIFNFGAGGGFFVPNWPQETTTNHAVWREEIADLEETNESLRAQSAVTANVVSKSAIEDQLRTNQARLNTLQSNMGQEEDMVVTVPSSILKHKFEHIELSSSQKIDPNTGSFDKDTMPHVSNISNWEIFEIDGKRRGVAFTTDCRTWICLDVRLDRGGAITDGVSSWSHPSTITNGLGVHVASTDYESLHYGYRQAFNIIGGNVYESGWRSYWDEGGAEGWWTLKVLIDGKDSKKLLKDGTLKVPTYWEIFYRAPEEMRDYLITMYIQGMGEMNGVVPGRGWHPIRIYYTDKIIKSIDIKAELWNYAFDVFRHGVRTVSFDDSRSTPHCPKSDPGYWAGDNCEASACGNVSCGSKSFGGRHKLYGTDSVTPVTKQLVWQGTCNYTFNEDPYADRGVLYGKFWDCTFNFDLNNPMTAFAVDIRPSGGSM